MPAGSLQCYSATAEQPCSPYSECKRYDDSDCGLEYSTYEQAAFCPVNQPPTWPGVLQIPQERYAISHYGVCPLLLLERRTRGAIFRRTPPKSLVVKHCALEVEAASLARGGGCSAGSEVMQPHQGMTFGALLLPVATATARETRGQPPHATKQVAISLKRLRKGFLGTTRRQRRCCSLVPTKAWQGD